MPFTVDSESEGHLSLVQKFFLGLLHLLLRESVVVESLNDLPLSVLNNNWEGIVNALRDSVCLVLVNDSHGHVGTLWRPVPPVVHVVAGSVGS